MVLIAFLLISPTTVMADQTDQRLQALFSRLHTTTDANNAAVLANLIWAIWHQSDNEQINELMTRGLTQITSHNYPEATRTFSEMIQIDAGFAEAWNKRATAYYLIGDYLKSAEDIERTLELEPRHFGALSGLGLIMVALGNEEAAINAFEATLAIHPFAEGARQNLETLRARQQQRTI